MSGKPYFSPSQIKSAKACPRKWAGESVFGWRQPDSTSTLTGRAVHEVMQKYLEQTLERDLSPSRPEEAILLPALKYLPHPNTPHLHCEQEVLIPAEAFDTAKPLYGFLDVIVLLAYDEDTSEEMLLVTDLKTTSNLAYMKSEDELRYDPQALIYGWAGHQKCLQEMGFSHKKIRFKHVYARTRGGYAGAQSDVTFTLDELRQGLSKLAEFCRQMAQWEELPFDQVPYNLDACGNFGGCHLRPECAKTGLPVFGDSPGRAAIAALSITRSDEKSKEITVSNAFKEALAKKKALGAAAMGAILSSSGSAPAAAPDILNPPDGDAEGKSGLISVPTDAVVEDEAPAAAPNPDAGYVAQEQVLAPKTDKPVGKRGTKTVSVWAKLQQSLSRVLSDDDKAESLKHIENPLLAQLLAGKAKESHGADVEDLLNILDALENGKPYVANIKAAEPKGDKESDKVAALLDDAKRAVVIAKDHLAKHTQQMRELDDSDDEDASSKFRTEVFVPAKRAVKSAEEQVVVLEQRLQDTLAKEAAEEEARRKAEAEAKAKAEAEAAAKAREAEVEKAADPVVTVALVSIDEMQLESHGALTAAAAPCVPAGVEKVVLAEAPRVVTAPTSTSWAKEGIVVLIKGAIPTRGWRASFTHIDEIVEPYRRRAEQQAMTAYYGTMKTDSYARICEEVLKDIVTGSYKLPALIVAPAMCSPLQDRVIEALGPYITEKFEPLR
jgi:hypothetical protein